jgi:hypothetical protein
MKESDKGDIGVAQVTADLITKGYEILLPVSASSPYDMVICKNNKFYKVQVKYRENRKGYIEIELRRHKTVGKTVRHRAMKKDEVDLYAVYCPEMNKVYYLDEKSITGKQLIRLRIDNPAKLKLNKTIRYAKDYLSLDFLDSD